MHISVAIDSFKGSLSTHQSGQAVKDAALRVFDDADVNIFPLADGGEGTTDAIISALSGKTKAIKVTGPLGLKIESSYGIVDYEKTAVIEMSSAAGITLISEEEKNPLNTTTFGVGELIKDALDEGCRSFIIGIGGSCTNDGGVGMLQALGFGFFDRYGNSVPFGAKGLSSIERIILDSADARLKECKFTVACDVNNPLCGELGSSAVYGKQKGATPEMISDMDKWLEKYADLTKEALPCSDKNFSGAGAAGGLGFALKAYLNAELKSGIDLVIDAVKLEADIKTADIVVTGEGRLDGQSYMGKAPVGVAKIAKKYNKPVVAFSGAVSDDAKMCNTVGIDAYFPILRTPCTLDDAMNIENAYKNLSDTAEQVFRLIKTFVN